MPETQYFTNIDGKYVKDAEARTQLADLQNYIENLDQPWQPLNDGYSNFWFELTNDTLSPWLRFSAKTSNAVIDWGDGSGEVALDTLTPTHTYSKAGKYVVKVKGVTGMATQHAQGGYSSEYLGVLKGVELNSDVTSLVANALKYCLGLKYVDISASNITALSYSCLSYCSALYDISFNTNITDIVGSTFMYDLSLDKITIPSTVANIGSYCFSNCNFLSEIHCLSTTPPKIQSTSISSLPSDYIIYVPVGYGDTYKAASGWSTYADHILEEGQQLNRAMVAKLDSAEPGEEEAKNDENR